MSIQIVEKKYKLYLARSTPGTATLDGVQRLRNKTIDAAENTIIGLQPLSDVLTELASLAEAPPGLVRQTASGTYVIDSSPYAVLAPTNVAPLGLGNASGGEAQAAARVDHVHPLPSLGSLGALASTDGAASGLTVNSYKGKVFVVNSPAPVLSPDNGPWQTWALTANSTPTIGNFASGQEMCLSIDDGSARTINWASTGIVWETDGALAPKLKTSGFTHLVLWKVGTVLSGAVVGVPA